MTDDRQPIDPSDEELVSAYLDDEVTAAERARVEGDPGLLALVETFRAASQAVGSPVVPLDQLRRDTLVRTAMAVVEDDAPGDGDRPAAEVVPLVRRSPWLTRAPGLAAAAALLFLVGIGLVITSQDTDRDQQTSAASSKASDSAADAPEEDGSTMAESSEPPSGSPSESEDRSAAEAAPGTALAAPPAEMGDFPDKAALLRALASDGNTPGTPAAPPDAGGLDAGARSQLDADVNRCATVVATTDPGLGDLLSVRTASVAGRPVLIFSHVDLEDPQRIIDSVADRGSCQVVFAQAR
jgi:hypothetical protein